MKNHTKTFWFIFHTKLYLAQTIAYGSDKIDRFIRVYGRTRYLALFSPEKYDAL